MVSPVPFLLFLYGNDIDGNLQLQSKSFPAFTNDPVNSRPTLFLDT